MAHVNLVGGAKSIMTKIEGIKSPHPPVVVVGLGNTILSDDAAGILVARELASMLPTEQVEVKESMRGGLDLIELISGYESAYIVDAIQTRKELPGHIWRLEVDDLPPALTLASSHEVDLPTALRFAEEMGYEVPSRIAIWAIEVSDPYTVSEQLSEPVRQAIPLCVEQIVAELREDGTVEVNT